MLDERGDAPAPDAQVATGAGADAFMACYPGRIGAC
jgi:hypothetical protein